LRKLALLSICISGLLLIYATGDFPSFGDPHSPAAEHLSPHYIEQALEETSVPNIVSAVLADYRGYDTMFETVVVFSAALACFFLLRVHNASPRRRFYRHNLTGVVLHVSGEKKIPEGSVHFERIDSKWTPQTPIVRIVSRLLTPFIQLFGLYVIFHGHQSPGGGFQGGVILGASFLLLALSHDLRFVIGRVGERFLSIFNSAGVLLYSGVGLVCLGLGGNFLDYSALSAIMPVGEVAARSWGILFVEIGVGMTVMASMILIYNNVASEGRWDEGL